MILIPAPNCNRVGFVPSLCTSPQQNSFFQQQTWIPLLYPLLLAPSFWFLWMHSNKLFTYLTLKSLYCPKYSVLSFHSVLNWVPASNQYQLFVNDVSPEISRLAFFTLSFCTSLWFGSIWEVCRQGKELEWKRLVEPSATSKVWQHAIYNPIPLVQAHISERFWIPTLIYMEVFLMLDECVESQVFLF